MPTSTDESSITIQGAQKWQQIGANGAQKLIEALLEGAQLPARHAVAGGPRNHSQKQSMAKLLHRGRK